jgi:glycosyltransferase involved in cell wall biosynthesis
MSSYENRDYKIVNWSSGVDLDQFNPYNYISNRPSGKFRLFYHGGISLSRGNLNLIKAAHLLVKAGYEIELLQVGILVDKEIRLLRSTEVSSWCKILPHVPLRRYSVDCRL